VSGGVTFEKGTFDSASGLRPMSAYVVIAVVLVISAVQLGKKALGPLPQVAAGKYGRLVKGYGDLPPYQIEDRNGAVIAASVPSFDLVVSPRGLWQGHTPEYILPGLLEVLASESGRELSLDELFASMLPTDDVDPTGALDGWRVVNTWALDTEEAARISAWIADEQLSGWAVEPFRQLAITRGLKPDPVAPATTGTSRLLWQPRVALSLEERMRYTERIGRDRDIGAAAWGSHLVKGLFMARRGPEVEGEEPKPSFKSQKDTRDVWAALMVPVHAVPLERLTPDEAGAIQKLLAKEQVAGHLVRLQSRYDREHPLGEFSVLGQWGFTKDGQESEEPYVGLELLAEQYLESSSHDWLEEQVASYEFGANRVARKGGREYFMDRSAGAAPVVVTTTINAHLQSFLGVVLSETLAEQRAAVAMGIVIDVASGEILAIDSAEAYPTRSFSPLNHLFTPGSTMKAITMAMGLDAGVVNTNFTDFIEADKGTTWFDVGLGAGDGRGYLLPREIGNRRVTEALGAPSGNQTLTSILANSSNGGMIQVGLQIPKAVFRQKLVDLGYGQKTNAGMGSESFFPLKPLSDWSLAYTQASLSFGNEISVNLWQHAGALATVLRDGIVRPLTVLRTVSQGEHSEAIVGEEEDFPRVFKAGVGREVREMMGVGSLVGTGKKIRRDDINMGTKTGTTWKKRGVVVCSHLAMELNAEYSTRESVPKIEEIRRDRLRLLNAPLPHTKDCYTSSVAAVGHLPDSTFGFEREVLVLIVVDEPREAKFGSQVSGPAAVKVLAEALGLTRNGEELAQIEVNGNGMRTIEASSTDSSSATQQPWMEADL
jgi:cell division protein FtsI/penicillin-binding protein 2